MLLSENYYLFTFIACLVSSCTAGQWPAITCSSPLPASRSSALQSSAITQLALLHCPSDGPRHCRAVLSHNLLFTTARQTVLGTAEQCYHTTYLSTLPAGQWPSNASQSPLLIRVSFALQGSAQLNLLLPHCLASGMRHCEAVP